MRRQYCSSIFKDSKEKLKDKLFYYVVSKEL